MTLRVGSLFAGIGGFDLAFERAGFEVAWCVEWDRAAQAVLRTRFPRATVYGDIREIDLDALAPVDVICGGFPCQDLSVAGKRAGLAGARSGLFHDAMRIVRRVNPSVLILENVPGLLSSNHGLDFATVLREVGEGWDCAEVGWRVLDSQYFGVAQRRRRVFVVAGSRIGCAESILALAEGGGGDPPSRGATREEAATDAARCFAGSRESDIAATLETTANDYSRADSFQCIVGALDCDIPKQRVQNMIAGHWIPVALHPTQDAITSIDGSETLAVCVTGTRSHTLTANGCDASEDGTGRGTPIVAFHPTQDPITSIDGSTHALGCGNRQGCATVGVAFRKSKRAQTDTDDETWVDDGLANTLNGFDAGDARTTHAIAQGVDLWNLAETGQVSATMSTGGGIGPSLREGMTVRRLTPTECERLQGFPDGWTQIGIDKPTADSPRYKQLGNAVTVNVAEWIARRTAAFLTSYPQAESPKPSKVDEPPEPI
jgi:DNA (cytosine-5)-methyltransferase 1